MFSRDSQGRATVAGRPLDDILEAARASTPAYVYDVGAMVREAEELTAALDGMPHVVAYAVKANSAGTIVRALGLAGCGAEVGSGAELEVARRSGITPEKTLLSGMGKTEQAIDAAIGAGDRGVLAIQIDSVDELARVAARARGVGRSARIALRINPGVMADTHEAIATGHDDAKFGVAMADLAQAFEAIRRAGRDLNLVGIGAHVGSQLTRVEDYLDGARVVVALAREYRATFQRGGDPGAEGPQFVDFGGGFGIDYGEGCPVRPADFARRAAALVREELGGTSALVVEPGRSLVGAHGSLVARVVAEKHSGSRRWLVLDAGMTDLLRPALYGARHRVEPLEAPAPDDGARWRVVGPVCESTDDFGEFALGATAPARVVIRDAGAYGYTMASHYNGRGYPVEVFVHADGSTTSSRAGSADEWIAERCKA
jgi:diaminopimelate decarboxylase